MFSLERKRHLRRGFTLLELMIASAIGLMTVVAATAMFTGLRGLVDDADRMLVTVADLQLGTAVLQRDVENAGYHFPSSRASITVHRNVAAGDTLPNGTSMAPNGAVDVIARPGILTAPYAGGEGVLAESDVLELLRGTDMGNTASVLKAPSVGGGKYNVSFQAPTLGTPGDDVLTNATQQPVLLFRNKNAECLGEVTNGAYPNYEIQVLDPNFQPDTAPVAPCPTPNMTVYRLADRVRYMVYMFDGETRPMLAVQRMDTTKPTVGVLNTQIERLVEGIEDLQVAALMQNNGVCGGVGPSCVCDDQDPGMEDCFLDQTSGGNAVNMRGVEIELTSRGQRDRKRVKEKLPDSMDRVTIQPTDDILRQQFRLAVAAPNLNPSLVATGP